MKVFYQADLDERMFGDWRMAYMDATPRQLGDWSGLPATVESIVEEFERDPARGSQFVHRLLRTLAR